MAMFQFEAAVGAGQELINICPTQHFQFARSGAENNKSGSWSRCWQLEELQRNYHMLAGTSPRELERTQASRFMLSSPLI